ncbi:hypothetical protein B4090_1367 [Bacillus licheniformis]|nr:hypothetical protein B4090_1367 [Bacillus licheniformis]KYC85223.1 hypothetical protein B4091_1284 [Bacillus licheniformis]KYC93693.1 hypothetical protein B4164_0993 [Bacillus licheniformis]OLF88324.1 hypothetical protein B4094_3938 [Bacillus licheniformis]OLF92257.1 hypothetical protein B4089_2334 [Bacillus licheniformis]
MKSIKKRRLKNSAFSACRQTLAFVVRACASVLTNSNIRCAPMLGLPRLQRFSDHAESKVDKI